MATKQTDHSRELGNLEGKMTIVISLMFAFIPLLFAVGGSLFWLINDARSTLGEKIGGLGDRLTRVESTIAALQTSEMRFATATSGSLARIEDHLAAATKGTITVPTLVFSVADAFEIRNALKGKFDPAVAYNAVGKVGDVVSDAKLFDFPEDLISKYPLLKTMKYAFDIKSQVLIVSEAEQRVVAVLA
jgi:hypothetical protein